MIMYRGGKKKDDSAHSSNEYCIRSSWTGLWSTWSIWRCPGSLQGNWTKWSLKDPSNPNCSVILWFYKLAFSCAWFPVEQTYRIAVLKSVSTLQKLFNVRFSNGSGCTGTLFFTQVIALQVFSSLTHSGHYTDLFYSTNNISIVLLKRDGTCCSQVWGTGRKEDTCISEH